MIILTTHRQYAKTVSETIFPYINLLKQSHANNVKMHSKVSSELLTVKLINSLLNDVELLLKKKLLLTSGTTVKLKLSDAEAIALYKTFLILPIDDGNYYLLMIRNEWITSLDKQLFL